MYLKSFFKQNSKNVIFTAIFATFYFEIAVKWLKSRIFENSNWIIRKTPSKMHMYDMVTVCKIVGGGGGGWRFKAPGSLAVWNTVDWIG